MAACDGMIFPVAMHCPARSDNVRGMKPFVSPGISIVQRSVLRQLHPRVDRNAAQRSHKHHVAVAYLWALS